MAKISRAELGLSYMFHNSDFISQAHDGVAGLNDGNVRRVDLTTLREECNQEHEICGYRKWRGVFKI